MPALKFGEHAVNDINRKYCPHWRKAVAPRLDSFDGKFSTLVPSEQSLNHSEHSPSPQLHRAKNVVSIYLQFQD